MEKDELLNKLKEIGTLNDEVEVRTKLSEVIGVVGDVFDKLETNNATITELNTTITKNNEDMEKLRQANLELFLKVGDPKKTEESVSRTSTGEDTGTEKRKFEDLFK